MSSVSNWYVVKVISGQEEKVKSQIEADVQYSSLQEYINNIGSILQKDFAF